MKLSIKKGIGFGFASGIITTLGFIVGLNSLVNSKLIIIGGILMIAIADAFSDAFGIHISEETDAKKTTKQIWESSIATLITKFLIAITFVIPFIFLSTNPAVIINIIWAILLITLFSIYLAKKHKSPSYKLVTEHLGLLIIVIIITYLAGRLISSFG